MGFNLGFKGLKMCGFWGFCSYIAEHSFLWNVTLRQRVWDSDVSKTLSVLNFRSPNVRSLFFLEIYTF